ncbi:MAG: pyridoxal phosphate-dependent decarboxylase family protein [Planctomycetota bacterium]|jgi:L-2,4-diaminobutyrate decarboxylase
MSDPCPTTSELDDVEAFHAAGGELLSVLRHYIEQSRAGRVPVLRQRALPDLVAGLSLDRWIRKGGMGPSDLPAFIGDYLADTTRLHHPAYMGHQVAVPQLPTALADLVHGCLNNGMAVYEMGAPATAIEVAVLDWMTEKVGWRAEGRPLGADGAPPRGPGGVLTHGGSLANLTALAAARAAACPDAWEHGVSPDLAVLAPASAHYSIARSVSLLGLGSRAVLPLDVDDCGRIDPDRLEAGFARAAEQGRRVIALVAAAGNTPAGAYDALPEVADACAERGVWLHVDGAHGASALVSPRERARLAGVERADSIVWDAHKLLGVSALCAAVLFRDVEKLTAAFRQQGSYLIKEEPTEVGIDLIVRAVECTKSSLGLKLFLVLATLGEDGLARHVETLCDKARAFAELIARRPGFIVLCEPESNIVCFRRAEDDDEATAALRAAIVARGDHYITQTDLGGRRWLRLVVMNPLSDEGVVERLLVQLEALAGER